MNEPIINQEILEKMYLLVKSFGYSPEKEKNLIALRDEFTSYFTVEKIAQLQKQDYFAGLGKQDGCMAYELEWKTHDLGSIRGGSKYKYGYEEDFEKIKNILIHIVSLSNEYSSFYTQNSEITEALKGICNESKAIKGLITGRTVLGKILSLYFPDIFLPIFTDQEHFLSDIFENYIAEYSGLEQFLINNLLLLNAKKTFLDKISGEEKTSFSNLKFMDFLYFCFPKNADAQTGEGQDDIQLDSIQKIDALEVQHYQSLIHRNFDVIFANKLKYFDEESQKPRNGHYNTEEIGEMDFLCQDQHDNFVVIELKKKSTDKTVGQILRYMGWVLENLCKKNQTVRGLIIAESRDAKLEYALRAAQNVEFKKLHISVDIS